MELESHIEFIVPVTSKVPPKAPDLLTVLLFDVSPELTYRWIEDYTKTGTSGQLNSIRHLTQYWKQLLGNSGEHGAAESLRANMSQQVWMETFQENVVPVLRNNRNMLIA